MTRLHADDLLEAASAYLDAKSTFDHLRKSKLPWILQPEAWRACLARQEVATRLQALKTQAFRAIAAVPAAER